MARNSSPTGQEPIGCSTRSPSRSAAPVAAEPFQFWTLKVKPDRTATLTCEDGSGRAVFSKVIAYTDFPLDEISFYFTDNIILLPSEY
jgi:hypothetical protein